MGFRRYEGRYCSVCALAYDNHAAEAQLMVQCDRCALWVHPACDLMTDEDYLAFSEGAPGYER